MKCEGEFVFKNLSKRVGGEFKNDKGQEIKYDECFIIKCDEVIDTEINERKFKFPKDNKTLKAKLEKLPAYTKINILFDVSLSNNVVKLVPEDLVD